MALESFCQAVYEKFRTEREQGNLDHAETHKDSVEELRALMEKISQQDILT